MKYSVLYVPEAEQQLAQLWMDAESRSTINSAAREIDQLLKEIPTIDGESRSAA